MEVFIQFIDGDRVSKLMEVYRAEFTGTIGEGTAALRVMDSGDSEQYELARVDSDKRKWIPVFGGEWDTVEVVQQDGDKHYSMTVTTKEEK